VNITPFQELLLGGDGVDFERHGWLRELARKYWENLKDEEKRAIHKKYHPVMGLIDYPRFNLHPAVTVCAGNADVTGSVQGVFCTIGYPN
jgi:hypothetical protein